MVRQSWSPSLVTFIFRRLPGSPAAVGGRMRDGIGRFFSTFVTRVVRDPRSPSSVGRLPVLVGSLDLPVYGRQAGLSAGDARVNGGLHAHAVVLVPPGSRLPGTLRDHVARSGGLYVGPATWLQRLHVEPIDGDYHRVARYVFKSVLSGRLEYDDAVVLLPRALSELPRSGTVPFADHVRREPAP
jgi:hypothetical protein